MIQELLVIHMLGQDTESGLLVLNGEQKLGRKLLLISHKFPISIIELVVTLD